MRLLNFSTNKVGVWLLKEGVFHPGVEYNNKELLFTSKEGELW